MEEIFFYSNGSDDGSNELLGALADSGAITWIDSEVGEGGHAQSKAYAHALTVLPQILDYRWTLIVDLDEFFGFDSAMFSSITDFLQWQESGSFDAIALQWLMFRPDEQIARRPGGVIDRFVVRDGSVNQHIKSICRTNAFWHSQPHFPITSFWLPIAMRDSAGEIYQPGDDGFLALAKHPRADLAWISHYFFKSAEEWVWKWSRNRGDVPFRSDSDRPVFQDFALPAFVSSFADGTRDERLLRCSAKMPLEIAKLTADPAVRQAQSLVERRYRERIGRLVRAYLADTPKMDEGSPEHRFRALLASWQPHD